MKFDRIYCLDTNIVLNDANNLFNISQNGSNLIVIPETTIDELDAKKTGFDEINFQAREFGRILNDADVHDKEHVKVGDATYTIIHISVGNLIIDIISCDRYDLGNVDGAVVNDRKIIQVAKFATQHYGKPEDTILLSLDVMCRTRAISLDVKVEAMSYKKNDREYEFIKELEINSSLINTLQLRDIREIDPDYKKENYCYIFKAETGHQIPAYIVHERIHVMAENELRKSDIKPRNLGQQFAVAGMIDPNVNICLIEALAGSGKTLLAIACGMRLVAEKKYDKIVYIRNSIESLDKGEDVGYLSGNEEKFKIYNHPLYDTLEFIVRNRMKNIEKTQERETPELIQDKVKELQERYHIETMWVGEIRGRTINNAYVVIDEGQNFSRKSLQTVVSRLDDECKMVCIGSNRQIDNQWVNKHTNGLSLILEEMTNEHPEVNTFATKLDKVVRGRITQWAERIFTK
jgi:PhoH-like ATPase